jgi:hypothetical protein
MRNYYTFDLYIEKKGEKRLLKCYGITVGRKKF